MTPPWRVEEFLSEFSNWRRFFDPSPVWRKLVIDRVIDLEGNGPTEYATFLDTRDEGFEALEPILGTSVTILCLVYPRAGRIVIVDIRS